MLKMQFVNIHYLIYHIFDIHSNLDNIIIYIISEMKWNMWNEWVIFKMQLLYKWCICSPILLCVF